jgi:hypothetical protein
METAKPFPIALRELVIENDYVTQTGKPNWAAFASELDGFHYESIRRVAAGRRYPSARLIEECARVLRVRPEYFTEYRIHLARRECSSLGSTNIMLGGALAAVLPLNQVWTVSALHSHRYTSAEALLAACFALFLVMWFQRETAFRIVSSVLRGPVFEENQ